MTAATDPFTADKPYRGPASYQSEDAHLFFGRDACSEQVIARLLSSRFMLLHAQSGAGKTSLLNARVLPELEARGWLAVRVTPQTDPVGEVRLATFLQLLPSPRAEAAAIERAVAALAKPDEQPAINELVDRYDDLALRDERRRRLVAPLALTADDAAAYGISHGETLPFFCRLLRSSIDVAGFDAHLTALSGDTLLPAGDLRATDLVTALSGAALIQSHRSIVASLRAAPGDLVSFFKTWLQVWGSRHPRYSIVLILDQFEQMFTLFSDRRRKGRAAGEHTRDFSVRDAFFKELRNLYEYRDDSPNGSEESHALPPAPLPLRYSISLRDEFVARLDPVRCFVPDLDTTAYHLPLLASSDAKTAIEQPAGQFGYCYEQQCIDDILQKLLKEGRFIEPAHLQIVCDKLWEVRGAQLAKAEVSAEADSKALREVDFATYRSLGYAEGILRDFISDFIGKLDPEAQLDALELLEPLITPSGTRNIAEWSQLINRPLRDAAKREALVLEMQSRNIIRVEWRLGGRFVEITHEFLIEPILHAIRQKLYGDSEAARFVEARRLLERIAAAPNRADERMLLSPREFDILEQNPERVVWSRASSEAMFRSAVVSAREFDEGAAERIKKWADRYGADMYESGSHRTGGGSSSTGAPPMDPTVIICQYLTSRSHRVRENAVYGLALFGEQSAIDALISIALGKGEEVRAAQDALVRLKGDSQRHAITRLANELDVPEHGELAYTLLGKIHGEGADVVLPPRSVKSRWLTARIRVGESMGPEDAARRRWRLLEPGMVGGGVGVVVIALLLWLAFHGSRVDAVNDALPPLSFGLLIGAPLLIFFAMRRSDPIHLHVDQRAAAVIEVARAALASLYRWPVAFLIAFVLVVWFTTGAPSPWEVVIATTVIIALMTAAIRAGTLVAYEVFTDQPHSNRFWQWAAGSAMGMVILVLGAAWMIGRFPDERSQTAAVNFALFLLPTCFALSLAYARSEVAAPPSHALLGRSARWVVGLLLISTFGVLGFASARSASISTRTRILPDTVRLEPTPSHTWRINYLPTRVAFVIPKGASDSGVPGGGPSSDSVTVMGLLSGADPSADSLVLQLFDSTGKKQIDYSANPPRFDLPLRGGKYAVEITSPDTMDFALELIRRARWSFNFGADETRTATPEYKFAVRYLTADLGRARFDVSRASEFAGRVTSLIRRRPRDWERLAKNAADTSITLLDRALLQDSLFAAAPADLNRVCWWGTLAGRYEKAMPICELGVAQAPRDAMVRDSRGLARALLGDNQGAIADFRYFQNEMQQSTDTTRQRWVRIRTVWIDRLQRGEQLDLGQVRDDLR